MPSLSSHVLDTENGCPAVGIELQLFDDSGMIAAMVADNNGRFSDIGGCINQGQYHLIFDVKTYFEYKNNISSNSPFEKIRIEININSDINWHIPLLISKFGYSIYQGR